MASGPELGSRSINSTSMLVTLNKGLLYLEPQCLHLTMRTSRCLSAPPPPTTDPLSQSNKCPYCVFGTIPDTKDKSLNKTDTNLFASIQF